MVAPSLALRFRDTTPGIDTIEQHLEVLEAHGSVWWGWWKKASEANHSEFFQSADEEMGLIILDRSTKRMFLAQSVERTVSTDEIPDLLLIPSYYHHRVEEVYGWFRLSLIEATDYEEEIANRFGESTAVVLSSGYEPPQSGNDERKLHTEKSSILVLSDLHFGPDYEFRKQNETQIDYSKGTLTDCLLEDLRRLGIHEDIAAILVTGDFTSNGSWEDSDVSAIVAELRSLSGKLGVSINSVLALPGNHDVVRYPEDWEGDVARLAVDNQVSFKHERDFRFFLNQLQGRDVGQPLERVEVIRLKNSDVVIGLLNSCRILATSWTEYGYVGPNGIDIISRVGTQTVTRPTFRILGIHHHLLPVNQVEAPKQDGVTLSLDASKILEKAQDAGVHIAIHGHQHMPHLAHYQSISLSGGEQNEGLTVVSNGSAGVSAKRRPGEERNTYCVFSFSSNGVRLRMRELRSDLKVGGDLFNGNLNAVPALP